MSLPLSQPSIGKLITNVRNLLNQPNASNSFWKDDELLEYLNEAIRIYFAELSSMNEGQFVTTVDLDITQGSESIPLPTGFFEAKVLYKKISNGYVALPYNPNITSGYTLQGGTTGETFLPSYYFRENSVILRPVPQFSETAGLKLEYIAFPDVMSSAADRLPAGISPIFKQLIEMYAVYKAKVKESLVTGSDTTKLARENFNDIYNQFKQVITNRSMYPRYVVPFNPETEY